MDILKLAAFSDGAVGGNPAGVSINDTMPAVHEMQETARLVGFSETAFAAPEGDGWRVRYFSPMSEVPFCGHATIALGAALAMRYGDGRFGLTLNDAAISVEGRREGDVIMAALQSPPTRSTSADPALLAAALDLFGYTEDDLDRTIPPAAIHGGADHLLIALRQRETLARMTYNLARGKALMDAAGLVTIALVHQRSPRLFDARNAFASGGVLEDPATGAAAAAFAGYLRDIDWPHGGSIDILQGEDMGMRSRIHAEIGPERGASVRVSGTARIMAEAVR